ncbi:MAG: hypothetical protein QM278_10575 [Pseudomonadota bacterium]|nr:hypothetical protein [Pseudomonadota bacterium]
MEEQDYYRALESAFAATFIEELIPGIIHNFANPLNGIMGRGQIMRRRLDQLIEKLERSCPQAVLGQKDLFDKLSRDIDEINHESNRFYDMFQDVSGKFYSLTTHDLGKFSLHQLMTAELRFADNYLNFKHHIKKEVHLDEDIPPVSGNYAHCSLSVWAILRQAMRDLKDLPDKRLLIRTTRGEDGATITFAYPVADCPEERDAVAAVVGPDLESPGTRREEQLLPMAARLLAAMDSKLEIQEESGRRQLNVQLRY